jgi:hypothetical protein
MLQVIGCWRLLEVRGYDAAGRPVAEHRYGPQPSGILQFTAARMQAALGDGRATLPPGATRFWIAYTGPYSFDGRVLVTRVDDTSDPARLGTDQVRQVRMEGERLILTPPPSPFRGVMQLLDLFWDRIG